MKLFLIRHAETEHNVKQAWYSLRGSRLAAADAGCLSAVLVQQTQV